jgi:hypothetical protein
MGAGQMVTDPDTKKRQKPIAPARTSEKLKGLMIFDFLRPDCSRKIRDPEQAVNGI